MWDVSSACRARPGISSQWAVLGRLLRGAHGLCFCSLRLYVEGSVQVI